MTRLLFLLDHMRRGFLLFFWWMRYASTFEEAIVVHLVNTEGQCDGLLVASSPHMAWQMTKEREQRKAAKNDR